MVCALISSTVSSGRPAASSREARTRVEKAMPNCHQLHLLFPNLDEGI